MIRGYWPGTPVLPDSSSSSRSCRALSRRTWLRFVRVPCNQLPSFFSISRITPSSLAALLSNCQLVSQSTNNCSCNLLRLLALARLGTPPLHAQPLPPPLV